MFAPDLVVSEPRNRKSFTQSFLGELCLSAAMRIEINPGLKSTVAKHLLRDGVLSEIEQAISALPADTPRCSTAAAVAADESVARSLSADTGASAAGGPLASAARPLAFWRAWYDSR